MKGEIESLIGTVEHVKKGELKRIDFTTNEAKVSIYKVTDRLVRIDIKFID